MAENVLQWQSMEATELKSKKFNFQFTSHNSDYFSCNSEIISHNSEKTNLNCEV